MERVNDTFLLVGRLLMASLFLTAGISQGPAGVRRGFSKYSARWACPIRRSSEWSAVAIEVLVPIALILGLWPRISALLLIAFVIAATVLAHRFWEFPAAQVAGQQTQFLKNIAILGGLLFYYVSGPGPFPWQAAAPAYGRRTCAGVTRTRHPGSRDPQGRGYPGPPGASRTSTRSRIRAMLACARVAQGAMAGMTGRCAHG